MAGPDLKAVRAVMAPFLITRCGILAIFLLTLFVQQVPVDSDGVKSLKIGQVQLLPALQAAVAGGDSLSYVEIARDGYRGDITRVYPPAFPLLLRVAAHFTGEYWLTGCLLSNLLLFGGLIVLYRTALAIGFDEEAGRRAVTFCCIFPATHFMSLPFAESLLFLTATAAIYFVRVERWWLAGLCGVAASVTKVPGSLVIIPLLVFYYQKYGLRIRRELLPVLLVPSGMVAYLLYLRSTGALDFRPAQRLFGHEGVGLFLVPVWRYVRHPGVFSVWNFYPLHFAVMLLLFAAGFALIRRGNLALGLYALACILFPLTATQTLASLTRYALPCCSLYLALGMLHGSGRLYQALYAVCIVLSIALTFLYALHFGIGMA